MTLFERVAGPALLRLGGGDADAADASTLARVAALRRRPALLAALARRYRVEAPTTVFGVRFPNPVGLAAGLDKDGRALAAWPALGFGFVEVGTVTAQAQPGNDRPRLYRLPDSEALVNRMGFNNRGADALATRLARLSLPVPVGVSLGKSKVTPLDRAVEDYLISLRALRSYGDYFAVNVSSPNTPGLRELQDRSPLSALLDALVREAYGKPVLVKLAPDLTDAAIAQAVGVCLDRGAAGVIATNTMLTPDGGLSGRPLTERAREVVAFIHREATGRLPIVGVGGVLDPSDAVRLVDAGASLVQLYTGLIYRGPALVRACARALADRFVEVTA